MAKEKAEANQLNLTVVALVALVAIVGLVALVMNAAAVSKMPVATGSQMASAAPDAAYANAVGNAMGVGEICAQMNTWPADQLGSWYGDNCGGRYFRSKN